MTEAQITLSGLTRIEQTIMAEEDPLVPGNCLQAAVATLTRLPLDAVPHFLLFGDLWWQAFVLWLDGSGYELVTPEVDEARMLAIGQSPRGFTHAVIVDGDRILDPHPDESGLVSVEASYALRRKQEARMLRISADSGEAGQ